MAFGFDLGNLLVHIRASDVHYNRIMSGAVRTMKSTTRVLTRHAKRMGILVTGYMTLSVKAYASFEEQLANVSTMLDVQSMKHMPAYERAIKSMAAEFGEGTATLSKGLYDILSASVAPTKAIDVLTASVKAAKAGMTSTAVAADAITTILNSYGYAAEEAGRISDVLFAIVKRGKLTFAELAPNIGKVAAIASTANLAFEELGAAIATITRAGLQADLATTSLRAMINTFLKPTDDAVEMAKKFGLEISSNTLKTMGLTGVLKKLTGATAEQLAALMPNVRGLAGFAAALKQTEKMADDLDLMLNALGLTQQAYDKMTNTLAHSFRQWWQTIKMTSVQLGSYLAPAVKAVTAEMREWISAHQPEIGLVFVKTIQGMVGAVAQLVNQVRMLNIYWTSFILVIKEAQIALYKISDELVKVGIRGLWTVRITKKYEDEIVRLQGEIEGLTEKLNDLVDTYAKGTPAVDAFFERIYKNLEQAKLGLEADKILRDFVKGWKKVGETMSPVVDMYQVLKKGLFDVVTAGKGAAESLEKAWDEVETPLTEGQKKIQQVLVGLREEVALLGLVGRERERALSTMRFQVLVSEKFGRDAHETLEILKQFEDLWDKIIEGSKEAVDSSAALADAYRSMRGEMGRMTQAVYDAEVKAIDVLKEKYIELGVAKLTVDEWYSEQAERLEIERLKATGNFLAGFKAAGMQVKREIKTWGDRAYEFSMTLENSIARGLENSMRDFDNWKDHLLNVFEEIYWAALRIAFIQPIAQGIAGGLTAGIGGMFKTPAGSATNPFVAPKGSFGAPIPGAQFGGLFSRPSLIRIAEKEPELVTPLSQLKNMARKEERIEFHLHNEGTKQEITRAESYMLSDQRIIDVWTKDAIGGGSTNRTVKQITGSL